MLFYQQGAIIYLSEVYFFYNGIQVCILAMFIQLYSDTYL